MIGSFVFELCKARNLAADLSYVKRKGRDRYRVVAYFRAVRRLRRSRGANPSWRIELEFLKSRGAPGSTDNRAARWSRFTSSLRRGTRQVRQAAWHHRLSPTRVRVYTQPSANLSARRIRRSRRQRGGSPEIFLVYLESRRRFALSYQRALIFGFDKSRKDPLPVPIACVNFHRVPGAQLLAVAVACYSDGRIDLAAVLKVKQACTDM